MAVIHPFAALRPTPATVARVAAVPYDVVNTDEARALAADDPLSFLRVSRPEIECPPGTPIYSDDVYQRASDNFDRLRRAAPLVIEDTPSLYIYQLHMAGHVQTGVAACYSVDEYARDLIRKHEETRPDKEDDRTRHILTLRAQTGPVFLTYRASAAVDRVVAAATAGAPLFDFTAADGVRHVVWRVPEPQAAPLVTAFAAVPALYIADGHHRSAAASRVAAARRTHDARAGHEYFLAVAFPHHRMQILPYHRVVKDLNGLAPEEFLAAVAQRFAVEHSAAAVQPAQPREFGLYLAGQWHRLTIRPELVPSDPVARLDVSLLADQLLVPILGITDPRRDPRIDFVGGIRGLPELERRVNSGEMRCAIAMHPTHMEDLMAVADSGQVMPPKSTWFEPKLADGLLSHVLD